MVKIQGQYKIIYQQSDKKPRAFLDLDGVITNWLRGCCRTLGLDENDTEVRKKLKAGEKIYEIADISEEDMWDKIEAENGWWQNLEILPWGKQLYEEIEKLAHVCFLTSPSESSFSLYDKKEWLDKNFKDADFLIGPAKEFCATYNSILIDDFQSKLDKFKKWGGNVFLWPNQYKLIDEDIELTETLESLKQEINKIC